MATSDIVGLRAQILANAKILLKPTTSNTKAPSFASNGDSQMTLTNHYFYGDLDIVVFGHSEKYTAALMAGLTPAIEGGQSPTPEGAMRKLLIATSELLNAYIPKIGSHQRNIAHGGGVFDEDMISGEIIEAQKKV